MAKRCLIGVALAALLVIAAVAQQPSSAPGKQEGPPLNTKTDKVSYALGMNLGTQLHRMGVDVDSAVFMRGMNDAISGNKPAMTEDEAQKVLTEVRNEAMAKQQQMQAQQGDKNKKEGREFLEANKSKPGVVALPSGLQYKILKEGNGPKPGLDDTVVCNYRGTLINGTEFDSSYTRGQPVTFPVKAVIKGWTEALQLMPAGSKWQLFIPSDLAYGENGVPGKIEPNSTLIFEVELVSIQKKS